MVARSALETTNACNIYRSLKPELETPVTERSRIELKAEGSFLYLTIKADDIVSMRSSLNTWLRLIQVAYEVSSLKEAASY
ncbi:KEOPS complex subunit Pcc1 [Methanolobus sp.]|uniref:KEOPS complex subunit Pcc1 n=1 Tax=Methanolobus sp. TaxID=1874737 RepID=UPI0025CC3775|nr:KEOPS complex subunit Pcc1 [Methanolobus sp.]